MLYRSHLITALRDQRESFVRFERVWRDDVRGRAGHLRGLARQTSAEILAAAGASKAPGALPSAELDALGAVVAPFEQRWRSHEEARRWAIEALTGRVTFAADGSQILPGREISMPIAAVQVASFENFHGRHGDEGGYRKEARFSIISPEELFASDGGYANPEAVVSFRRFKLEINTISDFIERKRGWRRRGEPVPVAFFDGTLLISYARPRTKIQDEYVKAILDLVKLSRDAEVPVVGYIDQSYARDLVNLLDALEGCTLRSVLYDAQLLRAPSVDITEPPLLAAWGDRTIFCYCLREGLTDDFRDESGTSHVGFIYLQTTGEGAPARLDVPAWIYEAGLLEAVVDVVRAECVVGNGYPYAIETADAAAVITARDRAQFLRVMQEFAEKESFAFRVSRKAASKVRRR